MIHVVITNITTDEKGGFSMIASPLAKVYEAYSAVADGRVEVALLSLQKKIFTYEDEKEWISISIIALPKIKKLSLIHI